MNKLEINSRDDVLKNVLVLINDLLMELPNQEFIDSSLALNKLDQSLPFYPFLKHTQNNDIIIKALCLYNLTILLTKANYRARHLKVDKEILIQIFELLSSDSFIGNSQDLNLQIIGIQLLQELVILKPFKQVYQETHLVANFKPINQLIAFQIKRPNSSNLQLLYNFLLTTWILSFSPQINRVLVHHYPELIGSLLTISKDSIKLKIVRMSVSILKNFISLAVSSNEQFKTIKLVLFHDGLNSIKLLQERKFASNGSDEELSNDLNYLYDTLSEIVNNKLTSFDEYLTELENPNLISWSSPTHKSEQFWINNSGKFKDSSFKLTKKLFDTLSSSNQNDTIKVILLNDLQYLIKNLGDDIINFINNEKNGQYKMLIMNYLEGSSGNNELKYEALKTIQLLVGHNF